MVVSEQFELVGIRLERQDIRDSRSCDRLSDSGLLRF